MVFDLARDKGAGRTTPSFPKNAVEYHNQYPVLLALHEIPDLFNFSAGGAEDKGKPGRERRADFGISPLRGGRANVLEAPFGG